MKVKEYIRANGSIPFKKWFDRLDTQAAAKVAVALARLEQGNTSNIKWLKGIGEYRVNWGPGYRIYLAQEGSELIILFGGGTKNNQQKDIEKAKDLLREYKARKKAGKI
ncbi:type II toxin-antitoxin system RelE/ParE family toxin [Candidatus Leptofilum sp.]|uniref:type II toxin-antitoxin system RelE/ParE family toxin n=1 Tax=Candidatus Leptofilum sp. TaxID=3241576 RepID=UPI003B5CD0EA